MAPDKQRGSDPGVSRTAQFCGTLDDYSVIDWLAINANVKMARGCHLSSPHRAFASSRCAPNRIDRSPAFACGKQAAAPLCFPLVSDASATTPPMAEKGSEQGDRAGACIAHVQYMLSSCTLSSWHNAIHTTLSCLGCPHANIDMF